MKKATQAVVRIASVQRDMVVDGLSVVVLGGLILAGSIDPYFALAIVAISTARFSEFVRDRGGATIITMLGAGHVLSSMMSGTRIGV